MATNARLKRKPNVRRPVKSGAVLGTSPVSGLPELLPDSNFIEGVPDLAMLAFRVEQELQFIDQPVVPIFWRVDKAQRMIVNAFEWLRRHDRPTLHYQCVVPAPADVKTVPEAERALKDLAGKLRMDVEIEKTKARTLVIPIDGDTDPVELTPWLSPTEIGRILGRRWNKEMREYILSLPHTENRTGKKYRVAVKYLPADWKEKMRGCKPMNSRK
jgi:hypothetical protein